MGKKRNSKGTSARARKNRKARRDASSKRVPRESVRLSGQLDPVPDLGTDTARTHPGVFLWPDGRRGPTPHAVLGVAADATPEQVQAAFRAAIVAHPPEQDPEGASRAREARDILLEPEHAIRRSVGMVHVPDADAWSLPQPEPSELRLAPRDRLLALAALYALAEAEVESAEPPRGRKGRR
ncbi:MAG: hypothetical protein ACI8PZ_004958 [Myxococcota bacterium]|jgi:hypothetical protein